MYRGNLLEFLLDNLDDKGIQVLPRHHVFLNIDTTFKDRVTVEVEYLTSYDKDHGHLMASKCLVLNSYIVLAPDGIHSGIRDKNFVENSDEDPLVIIIVFHIIAV